MKGIQPHKGRHNICLNSIFKGDCNDVTIKGEGKDSWPKQAFI
jgi:hypothetical protein